MRAVELIAMEVGEKVFFTARHGVTSVPYYGIGEIEAEEIIITNRVGEEMSVLTLGGEEWTPGHVAPAVDWLLGA